MNQRHIEERMMEALDEKSKRQRSMPPSVNYHINTHCNFACDFCFATFEDTEEHLGRCMLDADEQLAVVDELVSAGFDKITFAGGEPTLVPGLPMLVQRAKAGGLTTMIVTNGSQLTPEMIDELGGHLDWIAFSIDSADTGTNQRSGRAQKGGKPLEASTLLHRAQLAREDGIRIKLNTVVHRLNHNEDMSAFVEALAPERWKLFQVLPVDGQNDGSVEELLIERSDFDVYVERHRHLEAVGIDVVPENNDAMRGTYAMVDPAGRFFDNTAGHHTYSRPILEEGAKAAFRDITFDHERFEARGGIYDWESIPPSQDAGKARFIAIAGVSGSGKDTAAQFLVDELGYHRAAIADPIKEHVGRVFGLSREQLWGEERNRLVDGLGVSPRKIYQEFGRFCRDIDPNIWLRELLHSARELIGEGEPVVCTDVRTHLEFEQLRAAGAQMWYIRRPDAGAPGELADDSTERQASELANRDFDITIDNSGTLEELRGQIFEAAGQPSCEG